MDRIKDVFQMKGMRVGKSTFDSGCYLLILNLLKDITLEVGALGKVSFSNGYYIYVGSAMKNLSRRIARHKRMRKGIFWHIDYFRAVARFQRAIAIRSEDDLECDIARDLNEISDWYVARFGASDCSCLSHLFGMHTDPLIFEGFKWLIQYYRRRAGVRKNMPSPRSSNLD